jgi:hypothetical protein
MALEQYSYTLVGLTGLLFLVALTVSLAGSGRRRTVEARPRVGLLPELIWALVPAMVLAGLLVLVCQDRQPPPASRRAAAESTSSGNRP